MNEVQALPLMPRLLTEKDVAQRMGLSVYWLQRARVVGGGPPYVKLGRSVRYPIAELARWLDELPMHNSTSEHDSDGERGRDSGNGTAAPICS